ncbi:hypothetical protein OSB04_013859 [Centaurea solstitialis]|uniref:Benzyl alcohol O-benzoyltransferase n=1 Tax=Centaurea solstitialis TaxID=347529 RepID=A0AA38TE22_9ASTR|nr:hypothetical protein OSB04_013859 [Centaurea solstitialis]
MAQINTSLTFAVRRCQPELIVPAEPTPRELKPLSDIDDQEGLRFHIQGIYFYRRDPKMKNKNPASVIREALAKVLVFYYPLAGRLKEGLARKLIVDCSGEGVLFIEAEADVTLKQFGDVLQPPFPCFDELLYDVPGSSGILDSPLLLIQVTRLLCGGFIFAIRLNHTLSDGPGIVQFMTALGEMARGASRPSTLPVWQRELLCARDPPRVTCTHQEYDAVEDTKSTIMPLDDMAHRSFFFGPTEVATLRRFLPPNLRKCTTFEVLTACLWRCRTIALQPDPEEEMQFMCTVNVRAKCDPPLPEGYYGNSFAFPVAISTARDLTTKPLSHALGLVMKAKNDVNAEYMRSLADLMVIRGRPHFVVVRSYAVSNVTRVRFNEVDFGWGEAAYGGSAKDWEGTIPGLITFLMRSINHNGESGIVVPIYLPNAAMEIFMEELNNMLMQNKKDQVFQEHSLLDVSRL